MKWQHGVTSRYCSDRPHFYTGCPVRDGDTTNSVGVGKAARDSTRLQRDAAAAARPRDAVRHVANEAPHAFDAVLVGAVARLVSRGGDVSPNSERIGEGG